MRSPVVPEGVSLRGGGEEEREEEDEREGPGEEGGCTWEESRWMCSALSAALGGLSPPQWGASAWPRGGSARTDSCTEEACPSFRTRESEGVWNLDTAQEELEGRGGG